MTEVIQCLLECLDPELKPHVFAAQARIKGYMQNEVLVPCSGTHLTEVQVCWNSELRQGLLRGGEAFLAAGAAFARMEQAPEEKTRRGKLYGALKYLEETIGGNSKYLVLQNPQTFSVRAVAEDGDFELVSVAGAEANFKVSFTADAARITGMGTAATLLHRFTKSQLDRRKNFRAGPQTS